MPGSGRTTATSPWRTARPGTSIGGGASAFCAGPLDPGSGGHGCPSPWTGLIALRGGLPQPVPGKPPAVAAATGARPTGVTTVPARLVSVRTSTTRHTLTSMPPTRSIRHLPSFLYGDRCFGRGGDDPGAAPSSRRRALVIPSEGRREPGPGAFRVPPAWARRVLTRRNQPRVREGVTLVTSRRPGRSAMAL